MSRGFEKPKLVDVIKYIEDTSKVICEIKTKESDAARQSVMIKQHFKQNPSMLYIPSMDQSAHVNKFRELLVEAKSKSERDGSDLIDELDKLIKESFFCFMISKTRKCPLCTYEQAIGSTICEMCEFNWEDEKGDGKGKSQEKENENENENKVNGDGGEKKKDNMNMESPRSRRKYAQMAKSKMVGTRYNRQKMKDESKSVLSTPPGNMAGLGNNNNSNNTNNNNNNNHNNENNNENNHFNNFENQKYNQNWRYANQANKYGWCPAPWSSNAPMAMSPWGSGLPFSSQLGNGSGGSFGSGFENGFENGFGNSFENGNLFDTQVQPNEYNDWNDDGFDSSLNFDHIRENDNQKGKEKQKQKEKEKDRN